METSKSTKDFLSNGQLLLPGSILESVSTNTMPNMICFFTDWNVTNDLKISMVDFSMFFYIFVGYLLIFNSIRTGGGVKTQSFVDLEVSIDLFS